MTRPAGPTPVSQNNDLDLLALRLSHKTMPRPAGPTPISQNNA